MTTPMPVGRLDRTIIWITLGALLGVATTAVVVAWPRAAPRPPAVPPPAPVAAPSTPRPQPEPVLRPMALIEVAQRSGDYAVCERAEDYRYRCIAETELQQRLKVAYDCCSTARCGQPTCLVVSGCGGGGEGFGCALAQRCTVNQVWLCQATGGTARSTDPFAQEWGGAYPGFCACPTGQTFLNGYGCADCISFEHEETQRYCRQSNDFNGGYFAQVCGRP